MSILSIKPVNNPPDYRGFFVILPYYRKNAYLKGELFLVNFRNKYIAKIYKYIYIHDDETILIKDMSREIGICQNTIRKYIKWLEKRELIKKTGKHFKIVPV